MKPSFFVAARRPPRALGLGLQRAGAHHKIARQVTCMAHPRRVVKVAKQIEREIGQLMIQDKVMQQAICPERRSGFDSTLSAVASVTEVQLTNDLQVAKVYVSIYSDDVGKAVAMQSLRRLEGYVRKHIGRTVRLRLTPEIRFIMDDSIERQDRVDKLLKQMEQIRMGTAEPPPIAIWEDDESEDDSDDEDFAPRGSAAGADMGTVDLGFFGGAGSSEGGRKPRGQQQRQQRRPQQQAGGRAPGGAAARGGGSAVAGSGLWADEEGEDKGFFDLDDESGEGEELSDSKVEEMLEFFKAQRRREEEQRAARGRATSG